MTHTKFLNAVAENKTFLMRKYKYFGMWSKPKKVTAQQALAKAKVITKAGYCPYRFEIAKE